MFFLYNIGLSIQLYQFKENDIIELTNDQDTEYNSIILSMHGDNI